MTKQLIRLGIASLMVAGLASADTLYVNGVDTSLGLGAANNTNGWLRVGGADQDVYYYGAIDITIDGYARAVFCIDLFTDIYIGSTNSSVLTRPGTLAQGQAAWLLNEYWPETTNLPTVVVVLRVNGRLASQGKSAATQNARLTPVRSYRSATPPSSLPKNTSAQGRTCRTPPAII